MRRNNQPKFETTTLWDFPTQNYGDKPHGDNRYSGVTPAFVIWNLIQRYTMAYWGSGKKEKICANRVQDILYS